MRLKDHERRSDVNGITKTSFMIEMQNSKEVIESAKALIKETELLISMTEENKLIEVKSELEINNWPKANIRYDEKLPEVLKNYITVIEKISENKNKLISDINKINFKAR